MKDETHYNTAKAVNQYWKNTLNKMLAKGIVVDAATVEGLHSAAETSLKILKGY